MYNIYYNIYNILYIIYIIILYIYNIIYIKKSGLQGSVDRKRGRGLACHLCPHKCSQLHRIPWSCAVTHSVIFLQLNDKT